MQDPGGDWSHADLGAIKTFLEEAVADGSHSPHNDLPMSVVASQEVFEDFCLLHSIPFKRPEAKSTQGKCHIFSG